MEPLLAKMIQQIYKKHCQVEGWTCEDHSDMVFIFKRESDGKRVFAIRGIRPTSVSDLKACLSLVTNDLTSTERFKSDLEFIKKNHPKKTDFLTGHSLGGAIVDELLHRKMFNSAITFNPAIELQYLRNSGNQRYYNPTDFLYNLLGQFASNVHMVKAIPSSSRQGLNMEYLFHLLISHKLEQFIENDNKEVHKEPHKDDLTHKDGALTQDHLVQSVILDKSKFHGVQEAKMWIMKHGYKHTSVDETPNTYRFRQVHPDIIKTGHYQAKMVKIGDVGHLLVLYK